MVQNKKYINQEISNLIEEFRNNSVGTVYLNDMHRLFEWCLHQKIFNSKKPLISEQDALSGENANMSGVIFLIKKKDTLLILNEWNASL